MPAATIDQREHQNIKSAEHTHPSLAGFGGGTSSKSRTLARFSRRPALASSPGLIGLLQRLDQRIALRMERLVVRRQRWNRLGDAEQRVRRHRCRTYRKLHRKNQVRLQDRDLAARPAAVTDRECSGSQRSDARADEAGITCRSHGICSVLSVAPTAAHLLRIQSESMHRSGLVR